MDIFSNFYFVTFLILVQAILLFFWYFKKEQSYWKDKGVPYVKEYGLVGLLERIFIKQPLNEYLWKKYSALPRVYGSFKNGQPFLSVRDPRLIRNILVKDFHLFPNRRHLKFNNPLTDNILTFLEGEDWKRVRSILTPAFSSAKFRALISTFNDCSKIMIQNLRKHAESKQPINMEKVFSAFALDLATSSFFSVKIDSSHYQESELVKTLAANPFFVKWRLAVFDYFPGLMRRFKISFVNPAGCKKNSTIINQIIEDRKRKKENKKDFLQYLIDSSERNNDAGQNVKREEDLTHHFQAEISIQSKTSNNSSNKTLTKDEMVSQSIIFLTAGFQGGTGGTLSIASYMLALHEDIQDKARQEITKFLEEAKGELTYEALKNMKYVDNVISEVLRMYPTFAFIERRAETNCKLGDTGIRVEKGTIITIPLHGLHYDPEYFPKPYKFDPDRFTIEEKAKRSHYVYLPFGAGPRNCIATRFSEVQVKLGIVNMIRCFKIKICSKTQIPIQPSGIFVLRPNPVFLMMEPTQECELVLKEV